MTELTRRERERAFREHEILEAAMRVFASKGFEGTTMDDIAAEAEFSKGALYFYFKNKEELFLDIVETALEQASNLLSVVFEGSESTTDKLGKIVQGYFEYVEKNGNLIRILHSESQKLYASSKERIKKVFIASRGLATKNIAKILREGIKTNEIRKIDPELGALIFQGMMNSVIVDWFARKGKEGSLIQRAGSILGFFLHGVAKVK